LAFDMEMHTAATKSRSVFGKRVGNGMFLFNTKYKSNIKYTRQKSRS
jgi:hypothetical protein